MYNTQVFENLESSVRSYCRKYPTVFSKAVNDEMFSETGDRYIDFLSVAGSMNYGHNNPIIKKAILDYLADDNIINALDLYTIAKRDFFTAFNDKILSQRNLNYKIMCCGPTGTNAVEAAIKLARKNRQKSNIIAFSGAYHGMTLGSLALTTDLTSRKGAGIPLNNVSFIPYDGDGGIDSIKYLSWILEDDHSGIDTPAAIVLETVQAEGGINIASVEWLRGVRKICDKYNILMIVDDIQVGNGRTGYFFSFERAGIVPDMVIISKSISGFGLPMSLLLIKPELDIFVPAEHNVTFRGNQLSFIGATAGINIFVEQSIEKEVRRKEVVIKNFLTSEIIPLDSRIRCRGIGLIWGIDFNEIDSTLALKLVHDCFNKGLICEIAGRNDGVLKLMPPLTVRDDILIEGLHIIKNVLQENI